MLSMRKHLMFLMITLYAFSLGLNINVLALEETSDEILLETDEVVEDEKLQEEVTLIYDMNGGESGPENVTVIKNSFVEVSEVIPIRDGYKFAGWSIEKDAISCQSWETENFQVQMWRHT